MSYHLLDGRYCQGIPLDQFDEKGRPQRLVYFYDSPEGNEPLSKVMRMSSSLAWVDANDDGSGWTAATIPRGTHLCMETHGPVNLSEIYTRLVALHKRRDEVVAAVQGGATHGQGNYDPSTTDAKPDQPLTADTRPMWQQVTRADGSPYASKAEWKADGSPTS